METVFLAVVGLLLSLLSLIRAGVIVALALTLALMLSSGWSHRR